MNLGGSRELLQLLPGNLLFCTGGVSVARALPLVVTVIGSPVLAFSKYFSGLALKSLMLTVSIGDTWVCTKTL